MQLKIVSLILISLLFLTGCSKKQNDDINKIDTLKDEILESNYIEYYGRYNFKDNKINFYHTGTGFKVSFYGSKIELELNIIGNSEGVYFKAAFDNENLLESRDFILNNSGNYTFLFDTFDFHEFELVKMSEPTDGLTSLSKVKTNGYFVEMKDNNKPHFLLIGASGISGNGSIGLEGEPRLTKNSSSLHSFGYLTASHFKGSYEFVSSSGWGLKYGYNDKLGNSNLFKAYDYVGINTNNQIVEENFKFKEANYIIINAGGNDYSSVINNLTGFEKTEKVNEFKITVINFILRLRNDHPNALIVWTMTNNSQNGRAILEVINLLDKENKNYVGMVQIKQVGEDSLPVGANNHASYLTHQKSSEEIIKYIEKMQLVN